MCVIFLKILFKKGVVSHSYQHTCDPYKPFSLQNCIIMFIMYFNVWHHCSLHNSSYKSVVYLCILMCHFLWRATPRTSGRRTMLKTMHVCVYSEDHGRLYRANWSVSHCAPFLYWQPSLRILLCRCCANNSNFIYFYPPPTSHLSFLRSP